MERPERKAVSTTCHHVGESDVSVATAGAKRSLEMASQPAKQLVYAGLQADKSPER